MPVEPEMSLSGYFAVFLSIARSDLQVNLLERPLLRRLVAVLFSLVINLSQDRMMDFKLFGNCPITLTTLMSSRNCFSNIIADVLPPWH